MEDLRIDNEKLNKDIKKDLPEVKRTETGKIDLEAITIGINEKGNKIIPDEILENYYKELPAGIVNKSGTWRTTPSGGKIKIFGGDPEADKAIQIKGAEAVNAAQAHRRTNKEILEEIARRNTPIEELERLGLEDSSDNNMLVAANYAAVLKAIRGDVKALEYVRDTLGEKPTDKISAEVTALTPEDKEMLERISARLGTTE